MKKAHSALIMTDPPIVQNLKRTASSDNKLSAYRLNPYTHEQLYRQLYRILRSAILNGDFSEGEVIPSENQLRSQFSIARTTVRNAIALLASEGLVRQVRGRGTMVSHRPVQHNIWNFGSFTELARREGKLPITKLLTHRIENGELLLVRARGLANDDKTNWLNIDTSRLDITLYPGIETYDFEAQSLYEILRDVYHRHPQRSELLLTIVPPSPHLITFFGQVPDGVGYLCASGDVFDGDGRLVERTSITYSPTIQMKFATSWGYETREAK